MPLWDLALGPLVLEAIDGGWSGSPVVPSARLASESRGTFLASPSRAGFVLGQHMSCHRRCLWQVVVQAARFGWETGRERVVVCGVSPGCVF